VSAAQPPPDDRVRAYIGLGANIGQPALALRQAMAAIAALPGTVLTRQSASYRSAPLDAGGPDYLNAVVEVATGLTPEALLAALQDIERVAGRTRPYPNAPRTLDLDLLLYGDAHIDTPSLTVPHPRMGQRAFVLVPLAEIAPERVSPRQLAALTSQVIARIPPGADDEDLATGASHD